MRKFIKTPISSKLVSFKPYMKINGYYPPNSSIATIKNGKVGEEYKKIQNFGY